MISVRNLTKIYKIGKKGSNKNVVALNGVNIDFPDKGLVFLLGKSGSGKSTLLNSIGGLDTFDSGEIIIKGKSSKDFKQSDFDSYRNTFIGFIFQEYNILEEFSVGKNLALALELQGKKVSKEAVNKLLDEVDLSGYYKRKPNQLSGGQKQRVAIARALIKDPEIIMADEPTGALDSNTGKQVMDTLKKLSKSKLVIIVSHDREFAEIYGDRIIELKDGNIIRDETKTEVQAVKSASGVSFIDDKIIHIKKGQAVSQEDLAKIGQMIVNNASETDTIISFDEKSNESVKKTAFITDDGNREVFKKTEEEDIDRINYNPKDFKMIKSKLRFKDSFKMGASSLKHKPIRLIFTILLSVIAFTMFGVVNTMSSFNRADSIYATLQELNIDNLSVNRNVDKYSVFPISDSLFNKFQSDNEEYKLYKIVGRDHNYSIEGLNSVDNNAYYTVKRSNLSGLMQIDENVKNEFNLELLEDGRLPINLADNSKYPEICISYNMFESIQSVNSEITSFEDIKNKTIWISEFGNFTIVGIIKDNTDISKYKHLDGSSASQQNNYNLYQELEIVMSYGFINMCYVTPTVFETLSSDYTPTNTRYEVYLKGQEYTSGYGSSFYTSSQYSTFNPTYLKDGVNIENLAYNQAVIDIGLLTYNLEISRNEIIDKINNGLIVPFSASYGEEKNHAFELEIVGYRDHDGGSIIVSDDFFNDNFVGADYILTKLKGNSTDKNLIKYFENYDGGVFSYNVQCPATPVLDNFGSMIEVLAEILLYVGIGLAVFAGLMLMNFISTSISYKKREIGVLRAIGARGKDVFSIFFSESFIICIINFIISAIACGIICSVINNSIVGNLGVSLTLMMYGIKQIMLMLGIAVLVAFISSFLPVYKFAKKNPIDSINNR